MPRRATQLPPDIEPPRLYKFDPAQDPVFEAGFNSRTRTPRDVRDWVEHRLAPQLLSLHGVVGVEAAGGMIRELEVFVDQDRLRSYGLTLQSVSNALARENLDIAAGQETSPTFDVMARTDGRFRSPEDVASVLLSVPATDSETLGDMIIHHGIGGTIQLRDVATFRLGDGPALSSARTRGAFRESMVTSIRR